MSLYGGLLRLYPRDFREEYGEDMEQLLRNQLRDENTARVWARTALDLMLTAPSLRLEARMSHEPSTPVLYGAASVACLVLTAVSGTAYGLGTAGLFGVALFGTLAILAWRRAHSLGDGSHSAAKWWKYAVAGGAVLAVCIVVANVGDELPENTWVLWMGALLTSFVLLGVGVVLGVTHAVSSRRTA